VWRLLKLHLIERTDKVTTQGLMTRSCITSNENRNALDKMTTLKMMTSSEFMDDPVEDNGAK